MRLTLTDLGILGLGILSPLAGAWVMSPRLPVGTVAVIFPPGTTERDALARAVSAGATVAGTSRVSFIVIVRPDDAAYAARIHGAGALLVLSSGLLGLCAPARGAAA